VQGGWELAGRYRLEAPLGRGGMGEVWRAVDLRLGRPVAVKVLPLTAAANEAAVARFRREAEIAATLNHPGITTVFDIDEHRHADEHLLFLVMELMQGNDLARELAARTEGLPVAQVLDWAAQITDALAVAHRRQVVHRDIKPANLFLVEGGRVKICDFGIARLADATKITATGGSAGTPSYMAPEQIRGRPVDQRTDLYALGCVLYELLTGTTWVDTAPGMAAVLYQHLDQAPAPPRSLRPELPTDLDALVLDLLAKDPEDRPKDATTVAERLGRIAAEPPRPQSGRAEESPADTLPPGRTPPPPTPAVPSPNPAVPSPNPAEHPAPALSPLTPPPTVVEQPSLTGKPAPGGIGRRTVLLGGLGAAALVGIPAAVLLSDAGGDHTPSHSTPPTGPPVPTPRTVKVTHQATLTGSGEIYSVDFSPDGRTLATAHGAHARLWNVATRKNTKTFAGRRSSIGVVRFSPDGKTLATAGSDHKVRLWRVATGKVTATLTGHTDTIYTVVFSPDGRMLATGSSDRTARLWDLATGKTIAALADRSDAVDGSVGVAFSPDGKTLASCGDDNMLRLRDMATGQTTAIPTKEIDRPLVFSPDGKALAGAGQGSTVVLWDLAAKKPVATFIGSGHTDSVADVAFSPDGTLLASGSMDFTARLWDVATGKSIATLSGHKSWVWSVDFSPDGTTLAIGSGEQARLWKIQ
jgi:eukaryotic-like serine/threonine-protein kinase